MSLTGDTPRVQRRQRVLKSARLVFNDGLSVFDVTVRDLTESGARVQLIFPFPVPASFNLIITNPNSSRTVTHHCELSWQRGDRIGVKFVPAPPEPDGTPHVVLRRPGAIGT